ncbi:MULTISPECIES: FAD-dependent oxidoreductase [unclassified Solwaraspora]|uniref:FAD-dependent oxidoreductase n=1 Tax=unclassified Solwaraspora TaxID=2627926 RepID=UPI00259B9CDB|nr:FAD-dependent oxidoreductase [Solwaraspora sp. WMMA2056]WJK42330.1 FAD-dependent oxidoreductase [Solwaraspora sp. WMMA2056]
MNRIVIVGHGMAGARLAAELHARRGDFKITVFGAERHRAYNRIMLSNLLAGRADELDVTLTEAAGHGVDVRAGLPVVAIEPTTRTVRTADGGATEYDHLVLATGSRAVVPALPGLTGPADTTDPADTANPTAALDPAALPERVAVFRTLDDCRRILTAAAGARTALVLGGGLLGLEAARGLAARGLDVRVVHKVDQLMERQLDPTASAVLARTLARLGVGTELAAAAAAVDAGADGVRLRLGDGRELTADLLVLACGVRPDTDLARRAGLTVGRGVVVDDRMATSDPHIWAIGDCAEHDGVVTGLVAPAWEQARVLARVLAGDDPAARYRPLPTVTRLKAAGIDLAAMGDTRGDADAGTEELSFADPVRGTYARLLIRDDRLTGAIMLGDNPAVGTVIQLFDRGGQVPADRRALLLGRAVGGTVAAPVTSPALMPDAATVCQCNTVSKGALVRCWRAGARSVGEVVAATRATTGCGSCTDAVTGIVDWLSSVDSDVEVPV